MKERKRGASKGDRVETSFERGKSAQYDEVRGLLRKYLVHTREILNGKDFLFLGPRNVLHEALARIVDFEHGKKRFTYVDFAEIEEYFLLRVVGQETDQHHISGYFE